VWRKDPLGQTDHPIGRISCQKLFHLTIKWTLSDFGKEERVVARPLGADGPSSRRWNKRLVLRDGASFLGARDHVCRSRRACIPGRFRFRRYCYGWPTGLSGSALRTQTRQTGRADIARSLFIVSNLSDFWYRKDQFCCELRQDGEQQR